MIGLNAVLRAVNITLQLRVAQVSLARHLDLDEEQTRLAGIGGLMHDLGKAAMPLEVLNKGSSQKTDRKVR